ncbi:hypothetical protein [Clavibacter nebraskensis]|uniref:hypothetical protein n=1 Tax=Clavibacter nebraskensis TaxID=31963 RepID=UPI00200D9500|nr:hypothetical protein [Clavibacter nebraskensis]UQB14590.1 hypothetical protein LIX20_001212 [Clavibacter nebraskensis]UQB17422.1 hypothetical protein LIX22_001211 [Clavibacter nebraskensis]
MEKMMNANVARNRLARMEAALDAMRLPDADVPLHVRAYVTGARDALQGLVDDSPEDQS